LQERLGNLDNLVCQAFSKPIHIADWLELNRDLNVGAAPVDVRAGGPGGNTSLSHKELQQISSCHSGLDLAKLVEDEKNLLRELRIALGFRSEKAKRKNGEGHCRYNRNMT